MPRHLIGDAHEWINEIPTVPTHSLAKLQPSQRSWDSTCVYNSIVSQDILYCIIISTYGLIHLQYSVVFIITPRLY